MMITNKILTFLIFEAVSSMLFVRLSNNFVKYVLCFKIYNNSSFLQTTRTPALFEISPRPFSSSSLQNRGIAQFNGFDQRQQQNSNFQYRQDITFPPSIPAVAQKQRSNPYLSSPQVLTNLLF